MIVDSMKQIPAHMRYVKRVEMTCKGEDDFKGTLHTECAFGRWYYDDGEDLAAQLPPLALEAWIEIGKIHKAFHDESQEALKCQGNGDVSPYITEMLRLSSVLVQRILELDAMTSGVKERTPDQ